MSTLESFFPKKETYNTTIGETFWIPTANNLSSVLNTNYIKAGMTYLQADYPLLFQKIGHTGGGSAWSTSFASGSSQGDAFYNNVVLGVRGDGANGSTTFTDVTGKTVTANGGAQVSTTQSKFGGSSIWCQSNGFLSLAGNANFSVATSTTPFTIECWVYPTGNTGCIFSESYTGFGNSISIVISMSDGTNMDNTIGLTPCFGWYNGSSWVTAAGSNTALTLNTWTHLACVFTGSTTKIFMNGVDVTKTSSPTPSATWGITGIAGDAWYIGRRWDLSSNPYFQGYIDDFRFTMGVARYLNAFSPPTQAFPGTGVQYTTNAMINAGGLFVISAANGDIMTSTDATTWTFRSSGTASSINSLAYGGNTYAYAGNGGVLATSADAINWTARSSGTTSSINSIVYGGAIFVYGGVGGVLATSTDAITWTARTSGTTSAINSLTYGNSLYIYVGNGGVLATSTDAITWTQRTSGTTNNIISVTFGNGIYLYAGQNGVLATSTNGINWNLTTSGTLNTIKQIAYLNSLYVYVGNGPVTAISGNGLTWTVRGNNSQGHINAIVYGSSKYVYASTDWLIGTSTDADSAITSSLYNPATEFIVPTITNYGQVNTTGIISNTGSLTCYVRAK